MNYTILVKDHEYWGEKKVKESALTTVPNETVERMISRAGISPHSDVIEIRLQWTGRAVGPFPEPEPKPDPVPEIVLPVRKRVRKSLKKRSHR